MQLPAAPNFGKVMKSSSKFLLICLSLLIFLTCYWIVKKIEVENLPWHSAQVQPTAKNELTIHEELKAIPQKVKDVNVRMSSIEDRTSVSNFTNPTVPAKSMEELINSFKKEQAELGAKAGENPFATVLK
jgi:hypothetical protein